MAGGGRGRGTSATSCRSPTAAKGTLDALLAAGGWQVLPAAATDAIGRPLEARFLRDEGGRGRAVVELAEASGLSRVAPDERDALAASTFGTGQVLAAAIGLGCREVRLGLGGSATTDGGAGLLAALGARFLDAAGHDVPPGGGGLEGLARVDLDGLSPALAQVELTIASDVSNPLLGPHGAAATYGPQKGASPDQVQRLDHEPGSTTPTSSKRPPAGPSGTSPAPARRAARRPGCWPSRTASRASACGPGVSEVMALAGFEAALRDSDLVLTGEGRVDAQTRFGKTAQGVAEQARAAGLPCICFGGGVTPEGAAILAAAGGLAVPVAELPTTIEAAMAAGPGPLERAAERTARLLGLLDR